MTLTPVRTPAQTSREALVAAGVSLLADQQLGVGVEVALKDAIAASGVPQSSAYRLFAGNDRSPQRNFAAAVLRSAITSGTHSDVGGPLTAVAEVLAAAGDLDTLSSEDLAATLRQVIRISTAVNIAQAVESFEFRVFVSVLASILNPGHKADEEIVAAIAAVEQSESPYVSLYREMSTVFGLRLRDGWSWEYLEAVISTATIGAALRKRHNPALTMMRPTGPGGELQEWTTLGVTVEAVVLLMTEPNPRVVNAADTSIWLEANAN